MQVILLEDIPKLGDMGEVVNVKPGYARNYLLPQKLALLASTGNVAQLQHQRQMVDARKARLRAEAQAVLGKIDQTSVTIPKKAGDGDRLFGSVTNRDIAAALHNAGVEVDSKKILLDEPIKELGIYLVRVKLHADIKTDIRVWVVAA
jgi:large subunit ribosomal protein L9